VPFTLSHPAVVLPLARRLPLAALVTGSMSPDLEYPLRLAAVSRFSHTLPAVIYFCIPAGLLCLALYHHVLEEPLAALLRLPVPGSDARPGGSRHPAGPFGVLVTAVAALGIGALSHIVWDSFTHEYGWMVRHFAFLGTVVFTIDGYPAKLFSILQHASSLAGLIVILLTARRCIAPGSVGPGRPSPGLAPAARRAVLAALLAVAVASAVWNGCASSSGMTGLIAARTFAAQAAIAWMIAIASGSIVYAVVFRIVRATQSRR
jgi:hypothetical protein